MARAAEFRTIIDDTIDAQLDMTNKNFGQLAMPNGLKNGNSYPLAE